MLLPGLGQFVVGAYRRALVLLVLTAALVLAGAAVVLARPALGLRLLVAILALDTALLGLRLFAVVDAGRGAARCRRLPRRSQLHRPRPCVRGRGAARPAALAGRVPE